MQPEYERLEMNCPLNGKTCRDGVRADFENQKKPCRWWTHVAGKDPQSEKVIDHYDCAVAWLPVVGLEQSQMTRMGTATVQEFRNETGAAFSRFNKAVEQAAIAFRAMAEAQEALMHGVPLPAIENKEHNGGPDAN